jgi:hypothetical protein
MILQKTSSIRQPAKPVADAFGSPPKAGSGLQLLDLDGEGTWPSNGFLSKRRDTRAVCGGHRE